MLPELPGEPRGVSALRAAAALLEPWAARASAAADRAPRSCPESFRLRRKLQTAGSVVSAFRRNEAEATRPADLSRRASAGCSSAAREASASPPARRRRRSTSPVAIRARASCCSRWTPRTHSATCSVQRSAIAPRPVPGGPPNLHVREIDAAAEMDRFREKYVDGRGRCVRADRAHRRAATRRRSAS